MTKFELNQIDVKGDRRDGRRLMGEWFEFLIGCSAVGVFVIVFALRKISKKLEKLEKDISEIRDATIV